jgi:hypothetical protein
LEIQQLHQASWYALEICLCDICPFIKKKLSDCPAIQSTSKKQRRVAVFVRAVDLRPTVEQ